MYTYNPNKFVDDTLLGSRYYPFPALFPRTTPSLAQSLTLPPSTTINAFLPPRISLFPGRIKLPTLPNPRHSSPPSGGVPSGHTGVRCEAQDLHNPLTPLLPITLSPPNPGLRPGLVNGRQAGAQTRHLGPQIVQLGSQSRGHLGGVNV